MTSTVVFDLDKVLLGGDASHAVPARPAAAGPAPARCSCCSPRRCSSPARCSPAPAARGAADDPHRRRRPRPVPTSRRSPSAYGEALTASPRRRSPTRSPASGSTSAAGSGSSWPRAARRPWPGVPGRRRARRPRRGRVDRQAVAAAGAPRDGRVEGGAADRARVSPAVGRRLQRQPVGPPAVRRHTRPVLVNADEKAGSRSRGRWAAVPRRAPGDD